MKYKFGRYAIYNLSLHITLIFAIGYMLISTPVGADIYSRYLMFTPRDVLHGQIWRIATAILFPPVTSGSIIWAAICLLLYCKTIFKRAHASLRPFSCFGQITKNARLPAGKRAYQIRLAESWGFEPQIPFGGILA